MVWLQLHLDLQEAAAVGVGFSRCPQGRLLRADPVATAAAGSRERLPGFGSDLVAFIGPSGDCCGCRGEQAEESLGEAAEEEEEEYALVA